MSARCQVVRLLAQDEGSRVSVSSIMEWSRTFMGGCCFATAGLTLLNGRWQSWAEGKERKDRADPKSDSHYFQSSCSLSTEHTGALQQGSALSASLGLRKAEGNLPKGGLKTAVLWQPCDPKWGTLHIQYNTVDALSWSWICWLIHFASRTPVRIKYYSWITYSFQDLTHKIFYSDILSLDKVYVTPLKAKN